jgi:tRNA dimethylallyltransferase
MDEVTDGRALVAIVGPTGVGKTALAVALARTWPIEVVSVDSRQVYRRMDAGTGKPTPVERRLVPHHLVDVVEPDERYDAARFARDATRAIAEIRARARWPVLVGGTGLYLRALVRGLSPLPPADPALRHRLQAEALRDGPEAVHRRLAVVDPASAGRLHPRDLARVIRAIEIVTLTGAPVSAAWRRIVPDRRPLVAIGLTMPRDALYARLDARVDRMLAAGLEREVRALLDAGFGGDLPALQAIGYRHLLPVVAGGAPREEAVRRMKRDTRRYAKRQLTWFAAEPVAAWVPVDPGDPERAIPEVNELLERTGVFG